MTTSTDSPGPSATMRARATPTSAVPDIVTDPAGRSWYDALMAPARIAVVGASTDPAKGGLLHNLRRLGYAGEVIPINRRGGTIEGLPVFAGLGEVDGTVDLAAIVVPAAAVPDAVEQCVQAGVKVAYVMSSGFGELGAQGKAYEEQACAIAKRGGLRLIGPNANGMISSRSSLVASIMTTADDLDVPLHDDRIAVLSQSGAVGAFIVSGCVSAGIGVGAYISTGNEVDLGFEDLLGAFVDDPAIDTILCYVEGLRDGAAFAQVARRALRLGKAIVMLKVGVSEAGAKASASHTASIAGSAVVYDGVLAQLGVRRADTLRELIGAAVVSRGGAPAGSRIGVVTISGGLAVMATDECDRRGLELPDWSPSTSVRIDAVLPNYVDVHNPLDTSGVMADDHHVLSEVLSAAAADDAIDTIVLCLGGSRAREAKLVDSLTTIVASLAKPLCVVWVGGSGTIAAALAQAGIACFGDVADAVAAIAIAGRRDVAPDPNRPRPCGLPSIDIATDTARTIIAAARRSGRTTLDEVAGKAIMRAFGLPCAAESVVTSIEQVHTALGEVSFPLVAKLRSPDLLHKSDVGAVLLGLRDESAVRTGVTELLELAGTLALDSADVVLQEQCAIGVELILGASVDATFGPVITLGLGGVLAEAEPDVRIALADLTTADAMTMLDRLRGQRLLNGYRGCAAVPRERLAELMMRFAVMVRVLEQDVSEIDVNPLAVDRVSGDLVAVDALMVLR